MPNRAEFQVGDRVRCIRQHQWGDLGWVGEVVGLVHETPRVLWDHGAEYYIAPADLEHVDEEGNVVEWMDLTSYVLFVVSEDAIERGIEQDDIFTVSFSDQAEAEREVEWYREAGNKILASKKLTTRVPKP